MTSIAARYISTPDKITVDPGPDRLVIVGHVKATDQTSQSTSFGLRYDQIDRLIIDLLTAKHHQRPQVTKCNWCPGPPAEVLERHHPYGQVPHVP
jgi:hypothetical protein